MSGIAFVVKCKNILASLYVTRKKSRLTSAQSSITGLYGVRHSPLLLLTLDIILMIFRENRSDVIIRYSNTWSGAEEVVDMRGGWADPGLWK